MTLGLTCALRDKGLNVGYCKPLGQQFVEFEGGRVDKDAVLFADTMGFNLEPDLHSPVILGQGDTARYLDNPTPDMFHKKVTAAASTMRDQHEVVVFEGTGHPGVGSVVDLSNAEVARELNSGVILILEGGIGNTLDRLALCRAVFDAKKVPVHGVIINKVLPDKVDKVRKYVGMGLERQGLRLLGIIPFDEELVYPQMRHVVKTVKAKIITGDDHLGNLISGNIAGTAMEFSNATQPNRLLMVVSARRLNAALRILDSNCRLHGLPTELGGLIVTGHGTVSKQAIATLEKMETAVARTDADTYETVIKLSHLVAKIDTQNPQKIARAQELFREHADTEQICNIIGLSPR
jgi:BioD-like phosphotransacetylase family protein